MKQGSRWRLAHLKDAEIEAGLLELVERGAKNEAGLVAHLAEVDARQLYLHAGWESLFEYCLEQLKLGDFEAFLRINAARIARKYPLVFELLEARALHLTALRLLRDHLTPENHEELLAEACHKSKRQLELMLARRFPQADVPERLRELARLRPTAPGRYRLEVTLHERQKHKLERARDLLSHARERPELSEVLERGLDVLLAKLERRVSDRSGQQRSVSDGPQPRSDEDVSIANDATLSRQGSGSHSTSCVARDSGAALADEASSEVATPFALRKQQRAWQQHRDHIPNEVWRRVFERDGWRCTYVSPQGRRCGARAFLELDHVKAWADGGEDTVENLRVRCGCHNRLRAQQRTA